MRKNSKKSRKNNRRNQSKPYSTLMNTIKYQFQNTELLKQALTRQSAIEEKIARAARKTYQRLEFLGDRIINLIVLFDLKNKMPGLTPVNLNNQLTQLISNRGVMPTISRDIKLDKYIIHGKGETTVNDKMLADALEALIAAIYLDAPSKDRFNIIKRLIYRLWQPYVQHFIFELKIIQERMNHLSLDDNNSETTMQDAMLAEISYDTEHFDSGVYEFRKKVLKFDLNMITHINESQLFKRRKDYQYNEDAYFEDFLPLLLEEARAILAAGIELAENNKSEPFQLKVDKHKFAKNENNPSTMEMSGSIPDLKDQGYGCLGILLQPDDPQYKAVQKNLRILGIADYQETKSNLKIKFICPNLHQLILNARSWKAYLLGSMVSLQRMYDVCKAKPSLDLKKNLIYSELTPDAHSKNSLDNITLPSKLNPSQQLAIKNFLALNTGIQLLQGPPGTGKTTTIINLLNILYSQEQRVLVCAPSNKAVHVLAQRFINDYSSEKVIFVGVKQKLPDALYPIFIHAWSDAYKRIDNTYYSLFTLLKQVDHIKYLALATQLPPILEYATEIPNQVKYYFPHLYRKHGWEKYLDACLKFNDLKLISSNAKINTLLTKEENQAFKDSCNTILNVLRLLCVQIPSEGKKQERTILNEARIIFSTLVVAGRSMMQNIETIDSLIIDESAQSIEAESLIPFRLQPQKVLLVGDTNQLPPTVISMVAEKYHLQWSMMWRLLVECEQTHSMLNVQYRMHPKIRQWPSKQYYNNTLQDGRDILTRQPLWLQHENDLLTPYLFLDIKGREKINHHSYCNTQESNYIMKLLDYLKTNRGINLETQVGVITFYSAQVKHLQRIIASKRLGQIKIHSVDGFQGEENDIIIISFVRSNFKGSIGFVKDFRRLNVAITRARHQLFMIGNTKSLMKRKSDVEILVRDAYQRRVVYDGYAFLNQLKQQTTPPQSQFTYLKTPIQQNYSALMKDAGYKFRNLALLKTALTRQSAITEALSHAATESNQYLQMMGDKAIQFTLAHWLYITFRGYQEHALHRKFEEIISNDAIYLTIANRLNINACLIRGEGETDLTTKMQIHSIKAVIGAIFLDSLSDGYIFNLIKPALLSYNNKPGEKPMKRGSVSKLAQPHNQKTTLPVIKKSPTLFQLSLTTIMSQTPRASTQVNRYKNSAYIIPYYTHIDGSIVALVGKSTVINYKVLFRLKRLSLSQPDTLSQLIKDIVIEKIRFDENGRLKGKGAGQYRLGRNFRSILMKGQTMFLGGSNKYQKEKYQEIAIRKLYEESYFNCRWVKGANNDLKKGKKIVMSHLQEIYQYNYDGTKHIFYLLNLNDVGIGPPKGIIANFNKITKKYSKLNPTDVWEKFSNPKDLNQYSKIKIIRCVPIRNLYNVVNSIDTGYIKQQIQIFATFLLGLAQIKDLDIRQKFTDKICNNMIARKPNQEHINAAQLLQGKILRVDTVKKTNQYLFRFFDDKSQRAIACTNHNNNHIYQSMTLKD